MTFRARSIPVLVATCVLAWPLAAAAGVSIAEKTTTTNGPAQTHQIQIEKDWMRVEHDMPSGEKGAFLFDGVKQVVWIVNYDKKTYTEMTKADLDRMGQQMTDAMAKMQEAMKNLPPEQRAQMEQMMKGRGMPDTPAAKVTYRKVGTDTVGRWTCDKYEGYRNGQKTSELCTVDPKVLGLVEADFEVARKLGEFFRQLMPQNADSVFSVGKANDQGFSGVPVKRAFFVGQRQTVSELTDVGRQTFPASTFEVPEGFRKQPLGARPQ